MLAAINGASQVICLGVRSPVAKLPPTAVPVAGLPEGRIAKIRPVAKPPGKLKLVWH